MTLAAARAGTLPDISGAWFPNGNPTILCRISQSGSSVSLTDEHGVTAMGTFTDPSTLSTARDGKKLTGTISSDLQTITWSDGTYWSRASEPNTPEATPTPAPPS